jgi:hypothetical protein
MCIHAIHDGSYMCIHDIHGGYYMCINAILDDYYMCIHAIHGGYYMCIHAIHDGYSMCIHAIHYGYYMCIHASNHVVKEKQNTNILRVVIHSSMHKDDNNTQLMDLIKYISSCQAFRNKYKIKLKRFTIQWMQCILQHTHIIAVVNSCAYYYV